MFARGPRAYVGESPDCVVDSLAAPHNRPHAATRPHIPDDLVPPTDEATPGIVGRHYQLPIISLTS